MPANKIYRVILATDFSARCDRAQTRALAIASHSGAELYVVHAVTPSAAPVDAGANGIPTAHVRAKAYADQLIGEEARALGLQWHVLIGDGEPAEVVLDARDHTLTDVIVTGPAHDEPFGRKLLGTTVDRLVREAPVPVLVVKRPPRGPYRKVVIASDLTPSSKRALRAAARFQNSAQVSFFHAYRPASQDSEQERIAARERAEAFVGSDESTLSASTQVIVESGDPEAAIRNHILHSGADLLIVGTQGKSALSRVFIGSTAKALVHGVACDVLVARGNDID